LIQLLLLWLLVQEKETADEKDKGEEREKVHIHNHVTSKKQLLL